MSNDLFTADEAEQVLAYLLGEDSDLTNDASYKLYCQLLTEMPYGVAKARTATPEEWYPDYFARYTEDEIREWVDERTQESNK
jgi:hypothetical protein